MRYTAAVMALVAASVLGGCSHKSGVTELNPAVKFSRDCRARGGEVLTSRTEHYLKCKERDGTLTEYLYP